MGKRSGEERVSLSRTAVSGSEARDGGLARGKRRN